jgi:catechol-2,3-dioxygenase
VAVNVWHSNGAGIRNPQQAGLDWFVIEVNDKQTAEGVRRRLDVAGVTIDAIRGGFAARDPWGISIRFMIGP